MCQAQRRILLMYLTVLSASLIKIFPSFVLLAVGNENNKHPVAEQGVLPPGAKYVWVPLLV